MLQKNHIKSIFLVSILIAGMIIWHDLQAQTDQRQISVQIGSPSGKQTVSSSFNITAEIIEMSLVENNESDQKSRISIAPTFLVFTKEKPAGEIVISNVGNSIADYRLSLVNTLIDEKGKRTICKEPVWTKSHEVGRTADRLLRFAPRRIRLKPGEQQFIRISAFIPEGIKNGEYRSELSFSIFDNGDSDLHQNTDNLRFADNKKNLEGIQEKSRDIFVPLMVRKGQTEAKISFGTIKLEISEDSRLLHVELKRKGNRSAFGSLEIFALNESKKLVRPLKTIKQIALFHPSVSQRISIELNHDLKKDKVDPNKLRIDFKGKHDDANASPLTAEINLHTESQATAGKPDS